MNEIQKEQLVTVFLEVNRISKKIACDEYENPDEVNSPDLSRVNNQLLKLLHDLGLFPKVDITKENSYYDS